jgi:hypothetical protein
MSARTHTSEGEEHARCVDESRADDVVTELRADAASFRYMARVSNLAVDADQSRAWQSRAETCEKAAHTIEKLRAMHDARGADRGANALRAALIAIKSAGKSLPVSYWTPEERRIFAIAGDALREHAGPPWPEDLMAATRNHR